MVSPIDLQAGIKAAKAQLAGAASAAGAVASTATPAVPFANVLGDMISQVNQAQTAAQSLSREYQLGNPSVGIEETMIAMNKASLSFQMLTQVRNKVVQAYTEIMNMPL